MEKRKKKLLGARVTRVTACALLVMVSSCTTQELGQRTNKSNNPTTPPITSDAQTFQWDGEQDFDQTGKVEIK